MYHKPCVFWLVIYLSIIKNKKLENLKTFRQISSRLKYQFYLNCLCHSGYCSSFVVLTTFLSMDFAYFGGIFGVLSRSIYFKLSLYTVNWRNLWIVYFDVLCLILCIGIYAQKLSTKVLYQTLKQMSRKRLVKVFLGFFHYKRSRVNSKQTTGKRTSVLAVFSFYP